MTLGEAWCLLYCPRVCRIIAWATAGKTEKLRVVASVAASQFTSFPARLIVTYPWYVVTECTCDKGLLSLSIPRRVLIE